MRYRRGRRIIIFGHSLRHDVSCRSNVDNRDCSRNCTGRRIGGDNDGIGDGRGRLEYCLRSGRLSYDDCLDYSTGSPSRI